MASSVARASVPGRSSMKEHEICETRMGKFVAKGSEGELFVQAMLPPNSNVKLTRESLIVIARILSVITGIRFMRDYTRRRSLVIKWFDDNIEALRPFQYVIHLDYEVLRQTGLAGEKESSGCE